jgi:hypothetical protein
MGIAVLRESFGAPFLCKGGWTMDEVFFKIAKEYGPLAALVVYVIWDSRMREKRYISIIETLSESFQEIKNDVELIKDKLWR